MKHVKIMSLPECDKLVYSCGAIARQIGTMFVVDDENPAGAESYPVVAGGRELADGWVFGDMECYETPVVCRVGEKLTPKGFAKYVKRAMHEEVPATAYDLYCQLRENGSDLILPINAGTKEVIREYHIGLEFFDFKENASCRSTDTSSFYFEVYYERDDKEGLFRQLETQLMDYMNILDTEELGCKLIFTTLDFDYADVIKRLNALEIETNNCDMHNPR